MIWICHSLMSMVPNLQLPCYLILLIMDQSLTENNWKKESSYKIYYSWELWTQRPDLSPLTTDCKDIIPLSPCSLQMLLLLNTSTDKFCQDTSVPSLKGVSIRLLIIWLKPLFYCSIRFWETPDILHLLRNSSINSIWETYPRFARELCNLNGNCSKDRLKRLLDFGLMNARECSKTDSLTLKTSINSESIKRIQSASS